MELNPGEKEAVVEWQEIPNEEATIQKRQWPAKK
jgi:hypothetical protein